MAGDRSAEARRRRTMLSTAIGAAGLIIGVVAVLVLAGAADNSTVKSGDRTIFDRPAVITTTQYFALTVGTRLPYVQRRLGSAGIAANALTDVQRGRFEHAPAHSRCLYWRVTDRSGALVRLCFTGAANRLASHELRGPSGG